MESGQRQKTMAIHAFELIPRIMLAIDGGEIFLDALDLEDVIFFHESAAGIGLQKCWNAWPDANPAHSQCGQRKDDGNRLLVVPGNV